MMTSGRLRSALCPVLTLAIAFGCFASPAPPTQQRIRFRVIGFADRWADYGSTGDFPSFVDFLAIKSAVESPTGEAGEFVKLRIFYWPQDKSDPRLLIGRVSHAEVYEASRERTCDEAFSSLSLKGQVSLLDPQFKRSRFVMLRFSSSASATGGGRVAKREWAETEGTVATVERSPNGAIRNAILVAFTYTVDGHWYGGTFVSTLDPYVPGQRLTVRYDPNDPSQNDLEKRDNRRQWLTYAAFTLAGGCVVLSARC